MPAPRGPAPRTISSDGLLGGMPAFPPRTISSSSTFTSDCPLLHDRRYLLPYLQPEQYYRERPRAAAATVPAVQQLRRLVLPARRLLPEAVLIEQATESGHALRVTAQPPQGDGDPAFAGNAACACLGGSVVHAHGEGLGEVALRSVYRGDGARVAIWKLPDRARVRQLAVAERPGGRGALVAARLSSAVHFAAAEEEGGASGGRALREVARTRFLARAHHVCMSPCIRGEAAVVVAGGGGLQVLRLERASSSSSSCGASRSASAAGGAGAAPLQSVVLPWQADGGAEADGCWAAAEYAEHPRCYTPLPCESSCYTPLPCESRPAYHARGQPLTMATHPLPRYAEHPRCLYIAHGAALWRADLRSPSAASAASRLFELDTMHAKYSPELDRPLLAAADRLGGLAVPRSGMAGPVMCCVSATSLLLLDTRSLKCPVQQWRALPPPATRPLPFLPSPTHPLTHPPRLRSSSASSALASAAPWTTALHPPAHRRPPPPILTVPVLTTLRPHPEQDAAPACGGR